MVVDAGTDHGALVLPHQARVAELEADLAAHPPALPPLDLAAGTAIVGAPIAQDDLEVVEGIGPKIAERLHRHDIDTWDQLARTDPDRLQEILDGAGSNYRTARPATPGGRHRHVASARHDADRPAPGDPRSGRSPLSDPRPVHRGPAGRAPRRRQLDRVQDAHRPTRRRTPPRRRTRNPRLTARVDGAPAVVASVRLSRCSAQRRGRGRTVGVAPEPGDRPIGLGPSRHGKGRSPLLGPAGRVKRGGGGQSGNRGTEP